VSSGRLQQTVFPEPAAGYRTVTLYCGNNAYGYRRLEPRIGQYFGAGPASRSRWARH